MLGQGIFFTPSAGVVLSRWSKFLHLILHLKEEPKKPQTISASLEKQLPANEIKISLALDISLKHIYFLTAKYSPLALSYLLVLLFQPQWIVTPGSTSALTETLLYHPIPPLPSFWQVLALIRSVNTLWRSSKGLRAIWHGAGWSCQGLGECQPWRMMAAPWHTCVHGRSPIWVCKTVWKTHEIPNKPFLLSLCGLEGGEPWLPCAWCCMVQLWTHFGDSLCTWTGQNYHNSLQDNLVWEVFDLC